MPPTSDTPCHHLQLPSFPDAQHATIAITRDLHRKSGSRVNSSISAVESHGFMEYVTQMRYPDRLSSIDSSALGLIALPDADVEAQNSLHVSVGDSFLESR